MKNIFVLSKMAFNNKKFRPIIWGIILAGVSGGIYDVIKTLAVPTVVNAIEKMRPLNSVFSTIALLSAGMFISWGLMTYVNNVAFIRRLNFRANLIVELIRKSFSSSYINYYESDFQTLRQGAFNLCEDAGKPTERIWNTVQIMIQSLISFTVFLLVIISVPLFITALVIAVTAIQFYLNKKLVKYLQLNLMDKSESQKAPSYIARLGMNGEMSKDIRIFKLRDPIVKRFEAAAKQYARILGNEGAREYKKAALEVGSTAIRNGIAYIYLLNALLDGTLDIGQFMIYFSGFTGLSANLKFLLEKFLEMLKDNVSLKVLFDYMNFPEKYKFSGEKVDSEAPCKIELKNLGFKYPGSDKWVFRHINLTLNPFEKLAIVGKNGAGKTTLIKILTGFLDPTEGSVLLDGRDVKEYDRNSYYDIFTGVFQEFCILPGTIKENIIQSSPYNAEKFEDVINLSGFKDKLEDLPRGADSNVGKQIYLDGIELSGGEVQRLLLSRSLYKGGKILILDEPTAALDPITENEIYNRYNDIVGDKSAVFISHRLASTRFCDRIVLLDRDGIRECGSHDELMNLDGEYKRLFEIQSRYYKNESEDGDTDE